MTYLLVIYTLQSNKITHSQGSATVRCQCFTAGIIIHTAIIWLKEYNGVIKDNCEFEEHDDLSISFVAERKQNKIIWKWWRWTLYQSKLHIFHFIGLVVDIILTLMKLAIYLVHTRTKWSQRYIRECKNTARWGTPEKNSVQKNVEREINLNIAMVNCLLAFHRQNLNVEVMHMA